RRAERWKELADALGRRAEREPDERTKGELYAEQADVYETRLSDGPQAILAYRQALEHDPLADDARAQLEALYRRRGEWKALVGLLDERAARSGGDESLLLRREAAE